MILMTLLAAAAAAASCAVTGHTEPGAAVTAHRYPLANPGSTPAPAPVNGAMAGRDGSFCIASLPDGAYVIRVYARKSKAAYSAPPDCADCCGKKLVDFAPAFSPRIEVRNGKAAAPVELRPREVPAYCVRGEVRDRSGKLVKDEPIHLEMEAPSTWSTSVKNYEGRFLLTGLPAGTYKLTVRGNVHRFRVTNSTMTTVLRLP